MSAAREELIYCAKRAEEVLPSVMAELQVRLKAVNDLRLIAQGLRAVIAAAKAMVSS